MTDQYCLKWNNYQSSVTRAFKSLRDEDDFVDVTLSADGKNLRAHKIVLSACSPYFRDVLKDIGQWHHAVLVLKDVSWNDLQYILEFVYVGQVNVTQENLQSFLKTAELLKIRGLTDDMGSSRDDNTNFPTRIGDGTQNLDQDSRNIASMQSTPFLSMSPSMTPPVPTMSPHSNESSSKKRKKSKDSNSKDDAQNVPDNEFSDMKQEPIDDQVHIGEKGDLDPVDPSQFVKMDMAELEVDDASKGLVVRHDLISMFGERGRCHFCSLLCSDRDALTVHLKTAHQPAKHALCENCENFFPCVCDSKT